MHFAYVPVVRMLFGARLPEGVESSATRLERSDRLVQLRALADETRLRILRHVSEHDELNTQDIQQQLDLSQSAASRHLGHLSATGYLAERRCKGAKCYRVNREHIQHTLHTVAAFLTQ